MRIPYYHVDAFTSGVFAGNPAGVCILETWLDDQVLQSIACENRLPETAFLVGSGPEYALRWFTPEVEIDLCGHATLASGFILASLKDSAITTFYFHTQSGQLSVTRTPNNLYTLDFPARPGEASTCPADLSAALGAVPLEVRKSRDYLCVFASEEEVKSLQPDFTRTAALDSFGVIVTAPGRNVDFVSRFFAPGAGIPEDPVTGSSHCTLVPYWSERTGKTSLHALQVSQRGGELFCEDQGDRILISGQAALYLSGTITL